MQGLWVWSLVWEPRFHVPPGQNKTKTENGNNTVTNSIKTLKNRPHKKKIFFWNQIFVHCEEELSSSQNCLKGNVDSLRPSGWFKISVDIYLFIHSTDICWEFTTCQTASLVDQIVKGLPANAGDLGFDPWIGKIPWRRGWLPTAVFLPGESHGQIAWWATVYGVTKSWTGLSNSHFHF